MATDSKHHRVDYIEMSSTDIDATKAVFTKVFDWSFTDYGPDYTSFEDGRMTGGFYRAATPSPAGALLVLYSSNLEVSRDAVKDAGCLIVKEIFSFPGGRRFHFQEPGGNELAVWSE